MAQERPRFSVGYISNESVQRFIDAVEVTEEYQYTDIFLSDHALKKNPYAWLALAAEHSSEIGLGTGVTNPYSRNPAMTAAAIGTIDEVSEGRAILGMGAGGHGVGPFGYEQANPIGDMYHAIKTTRRLLRGETVSIERDEFECHEAAFEFEPYDTDIPVYIGGRGPQLLKLAGDVADGAIAGAGLSSVAAMEYARERVEIGADESGRSLEDIDLRCWTFLSIGEDEDSALDAVTPFIATLVKSHAPEETLRSFGIAESDLERVKRIDDIHRRSASELRDALSRDIINLFAITGTAEDCYERVTELHDSGVDHITVVPHQNASYDRVENLEVFAEEVISQVG